LNKAPTTARIYREIEDVPAATEESTSIQANLQADFNCENPQCSRVDEPEHDCLVRAHVAIETD
jgi:hypothetical protein